MKRMKKLASLLLVVVMVLGMSVTVLAESTQKQSSTNDATGSITITNPTEGVTYYAYKIFDVAYSADRSEAGGYSYTISSDSAWYNIVNSYITSNTETDENGSVNNSGLELEVSAGNEKIFVVTVTDNFSPANFAAYLNTALAEKLNGTEEDTLQYDSETLYGVSLGKLESGSNKTSLNKAEMPLGYYFVVGYETTAEGGYSIKTDAICNLTTTEPDASIYNKNHIEFEKEDDQEDVQVGDTVHYTIKSKVPDYTGYSSYTYSITDTMSSGLTFNDDIVVKIGSAVVYVSKDTTIEGKTYKTTDNVDWIEKDVPTGDNANGYTLNIVDIKTNCTIDDDIEITYSATVNEDAVSSVENNKAVLTYSNNPTSNETGEKTEIETVYSTKIQVIKYTGESATEGTKLSGAKFKLVKYVAEGGTSDSPGVEKATDGTSQTKYYYRANEDTDENLTGITWLAEAKASDATEVTTGTNGTVSFDGLESGIYYLVETAAPDGYNLLTEEQKVEIGKVSIPKDFSDGNVEDYLRSLLGKDSGDSLTDLKNTVLTVKAEVENKTGTVLPSTGGIGTTIFYIVGGILVVGAAILLVTKKRMNGAKK